MCIVCEITVEVVGVNSLVLIEVGSLTADENGSRMIRTGVTADVVVEGHHVIVLCIAVFGEREMHGFMAHRAGGDLGGTRDTGQLVDFLGMGSRRIHYDGGVNLGVIRECDASNSVTSCPDMLDSALKPKHPASGLSGLLQILRCKTRIIAVPSFREEHATINSWPTWLTKMRIVRDHRWTKTTQIPGGKLLSDFGR